MKTPSRLAAILAALALQSTLLAQTANAPTLTVLRSDFSPLAYGLDGRLHSLGSSMKTDGSDLQTRTIDEPGFALINTLSFRSALHFQWPINSQGLFTASAYPLSFDGTVPTSCPIHDTWRDPNDIYREEYRYARLVRMGATGQPQALPISGKYNLCIDGPMAQGALGATYLMAQAFNAKGRGQEWGIYRLSDDGQALDLIKKFASKDEPLLIAPSADGQAIHGVVSRTQGNTLALFRLTDDGSYTVRREFSSSEFTSISAMVDHGGYLHIAGDAGLTSVLKRVNASGPINQVETLHEFNTTDGVDPNSLAVGLDGNIYGLTTRGGSPGLSGSGSGYGSVFRIVTSSGAVETEIYDGFDDRSGPDGSNPGHLLAGRDGKLYGTSTAGTFALDVGIVPAGPVIALSSSAPELVWTGDATQPSSTITWEAQGAQSCAASGDWSGTKAASGSEALTPVRAGANVYTLNCSDNAGATQALSITVRAVPPPPLPTVSLTTSATTAPMGSSVTLSWQASEALSCTASGDWTGSKPLDEAGHGSEVMAIPNTDTETTFTYTLTCTGAGGEASQTASVASTIPMNEPVSMQVRGGSGSAAAGLLAALAALALLLRGRQHGSVRVKRIPRPPAAH